MRAGFGRAISGRTVAMLVAGAILIIDVAIAPYRFADYFSYLLLTDGLYFFQAQSWFGFEAASNIIFLSLRALTGSTETAVNIAHYLVGACCAASYWRLAQHDDVDWRGLVFVFGLFGATLAFVTIRATPAYFLVAVAALDGARGRPRALLLVALATLFHVSAVLAALPVLAALAQNRLRSLNWIGTSTRRLALAVGPVALAYFLLNTFATATLTALIDAVPFLGKYVAYTATLDPVTNANSLAPARSIMHFFYLIAVSGFAGLMLLLPDQRCRRLRAYIVISYALFMFLQFSPVTAYRQSQFWIIPAALVFPWRVVAPAGAPAVLLLLLGIAMFLFTLQGVVT